MWKMRLFRKEIIINPIFLFISLILLGSVIISNFINFLDFEINVVFLQLGVLFLGLAFLYENSWRKFKDRIGLKLEIKKIIIYSILGIIGVIAYMIILSIAANYFEFNDQSQVRNVILELFTPLIIFIAVFVAPISEELFFRGVLVEKTGVIISSVIFGLAHFAYGSVIEVVAAIGIGIILALIYKKTKNIIPCVLIHFMYNGLSMIAFFLVYGGII